MNDKAEPDFEALRAKRNELAATAARAIATELGVPEGEPVFSSFNPNACYCDCANHGPCEHKWDGEPYQDEGLYSATCSRCGVTAFSHSIRFLP
jgi:hypothetical protein